MRALCDTLSNQGFATTGVSSGDAALAALGKESFDLVLTDLMMPGMDGIALLEEALRIDPHVVCVIMTGQGTITSAVEAMKRGAIDYVLKPFRLAAILPVLSRALIVRRLRAENLQLREALSIHELTTSMAFALDPDSVVRTLVETTHGLSEDGTASVLLLSEDGQELRVTAAQGAEASSITGVRQTMTDELSDWVDRARNQLAAPGGIDDPEVAADHPLSGLRSGLAFPMVAGGKFVGALICMPRQEARRVERGRIRALGILAGVGAAALGAANLVRRLADAERRYRRLAENAQDLIYRYELVPSRRFVYVNPAVTPMLGHSPEEFYADPDLGSSLFHAENLGRADGSATDHATPDASKVTRWVRRDGQEVYIEKRCALLRDDAGQPVAVEGILRDVTDRQHAEAAIHALNRELEARVAELDRQQEELRRSNEVLERSNIELEQFAYVASHDLQTPLRSIAGFVQVLGVQYADHLDANARRFIDRAVDGTRQMQSILQALLDHTGVASRSRPFERVDLGHVYEDVVEILGASIRDADAKVTRDDLPTVLGDRAQLVQVVQHLVGNALTYHGAGPPRIHVSAHRDGENVVLSVRDEGLGIDPEYHDRIFEPFSRLHTEREYPGMGIGLAICRRIVTRHRGQIWVRSMPGEGSVFAVELPTGEEMVAKRGAAPGPG
jgi:PAS domain S-box-containing protein